MRLTLGTPQFVALCGGVGGAKLALGLADTLGEKLTVIVNTGDDFEHLGFHISPDIDTVVYTLAGLANPETGWGRAAETWSFMEALEALDGPVWFKLGDKDLAMHAERTRWLSEGRPLSAFCAQTRDRLRIRPTILPMSDDPVRTRLDTAEGEMAFQTYFVARRCEPEVRAIHYDGANTARPLGFALEALAAPGLGGVIICPSNPYLSIDPILSLPGVRRALAACRAPVIAVTPLIGGKAVKGPAAKLMAELGVEASPLSVARHYRPFLDGFIVDERDAADADRFPVSVQPAQTLMTDLAGKVSLARSAIAFCDRLRNQKSARIAGVTA